MQQMDFQSLAEQEQLSLLLEREAAFDKAYEAQTQKSKELGLTWKQDSAASYIDSDEEVPEYLASTLQNADDELKAKLRALKPLSEARWTAVDEMLETKKALRNSEFESVREKAWADVDEKIAKIETGRFKGQYLQNVLYALSVGPFSSSDEPDDMRIRLQTGDYEHYNLPDLLGTHWLIPSSGIYGDFGERRSILTEGGAEVLERLTLKYGKPEWAAKIQPEAAVADHDGGARPA